MNWKAFWNEQALETDPKAQVGRQVSGSLHDDEVLHKIANKISSQLDLQPNDSLLDVCCGNGFLTELLASKCKEVYGVDFSELLIESASKRNKPNTHWICADATSFELNRKFNKILLYFSFQYIEKDEQAIAVLLQLKKHLNDNGTILIGDVPDSAKWFTYYNSIPKLFFAIWSKIKGHNDMGRFWKIEKLIQLCHACGMKATLEKQESWQPYSWYRFDIKIVNSVS